MKYSNSCSIRLEPFSPGCVIIIISRAPLHFLDGDKKYKTDGVQSMCVRVWWSAWKKNKIDAVRCGRHILWNNNHNNNAKKKKKKKKKEKKRLFFSVKENPLFSVCVCCVYVRGMTRWQLIVKSITERNKGNVVAHPDSRTAFNHRLRGGILISIASQEPCFPPNPSGFLLIYLGLCPVDQSRAGSTQNNDTIQSKRLSIASAPSVWIYSY